MTIEAQVAIKEASAAIWRVITDIENAEMTIRGIEGIEILEKPEHGLEGLKWRETRTLFGKTATEEMWITDAVANEFYRTRAESHGCVYITTISISGDNEGNLLTMALQIKPQGFVSKIVSTLTGVAFKGSLRKMMMQDLRDIKAAVEGNVRDAPA